MKTFLLACAAMGVASAANATVVFNFGTIPDNVIPVVNPVAKTTGDLGQYALFTVSGLTVEASAFGPASTSSGHPADDLYGKNLSGDENGLGMTNDPSGEHEIYYNEGFIQLDLSALLGKVDPSKIFAAFNSTTSGEQWTVYGSNTAGAIGSSNLPTVKTLIGSGTNETTTEQLSGGFTYYDVVSTVAAHGSNGGNVLLKTLTVTPVPEPGSWALMITGFGGLGALARRRRARSEVTAA
jgi:hypothetical protein